MAVLKPAIILRGAICAPVILVIVWQVMTVIVMVGPQHLYNIVIILTVSHYIYLDIDECLEGTDGCVQLCSNIVGSYVCGCNSGYRLATDGHACNGIYLIHCDALSYTY